MSTLQVHITAGPQAGARLQLNQSPVSFGRSADNTLVLELDVVSRQHGELVCDEEGNWSLVNHSANTTRVGRKKATKKPIPLTNGVPINIGDTEVFRVYLNDPAAAAAPADMQDAPADQPSDRAPGAGLAGRSKLWIGIGVWIAVLVLGAAVLKLGLSSGDEDIPTGSAFYYPGHEIPDMQGPEAGKQAIRNLLAEPLPQQDPNDSLYNGHLADARRATEGGERMLYDAYTHYQRAMSYAQDRQNPLEPADKIKYNNTVDKLAEYIHDGYINAYRLYHEGDYTSATHQLNAIRERYYRGGHRLDDPLDDHIKKLRNAAHARSGK